MAAMPPIILGKDMAEESGATVGSTVLVTAPGRTDSVWHGAEV